MNMQNASVNARTVASEFTEKKKGFLVFGAVAEIHDISSKRTPKRCKKNS